MREQIGWGKEIAKAVWDDNKIEAIKITRALTGYKLKNAKALVERFDVWRREEKGYSRSNGEILADIYNMVAAIQQVRNSQGKDSAIGEESVENLVKSALGELSMPGLDRTVKKIHALVYIARGLTNADEHSEAFLLVLQELFLRTR